MISVLLLFAVGVEQAAGSVEFVASGSKTSRSWSYVCLLSVVFQVKNISKVLTKVEESLHFSKTTACWVDLTKLIIFIFLFEHLFSCVWYFVGILNEEDGQQNWLKTNGIADKPYTVQYLHAFYFASVTMISVGYGDIVPTSITNNSILDDTEMLVTILFMFCSCLQLSFSVSSIFSILSDLTQGTAELRTRIRAVNEFLQRKKISPPLQSKIREYLTYFWQEQSKDQIDEISIANQLSQKLKEELMTEGSFINNF
jgi:potassium voltage-gated channel Eag-related subfamily H protein 5